MTQGRSVASQAAGVPRCSYCGEPARLLNSVEIYGRDLGMLWRCEPCDAHVSCHPKTIKPLGTLANPGLRLRRKEAHGAFDPLWKSGRMKRTEAYRVLQCLMELSEDDAHIAKMDADQCAELVARLNSPVALRKAVKQANRMKHA